MNREIQINLIKGVAKAYNNLDYKEIEVIADENITYSSQSVLSSLNGKDEVINYLKEKFESIKRSNNLVFAELAYMGTQESWTIKISDLNDEPCILLSQGSKEDKGAIILVHTNNLELVVKIEICTVVPHWSTAIGTGVYPS
jgi:hypothetical protein